MFKNEIDSGKGFMRLKAFIYIHGERDYSHVYVRVVACTSLSRPNVKHCVLSFPFETSNIFVEERTFF